MSGYIRWFDEAKRWVKIVLSIFGIFAFLYRLFKLIISKCENKKELVYLILMVIPLVNFIIVIADIVFSVKGRNFVLSFDEWGEKKEEKAE